MKKIWFLFLSITVVLIVLVSCMNNNQTTQISEETKLDTTQIEETVDTTIVSETQETIATTNETTIKEIETTKEETTIVETEETEVIIPVETYTLYDSPHDPTSHKIGSYVDLVYDDEFCDVKYKVEQDLGTKEKITISVQMKKGLYFTGFYRNTFDDSNLITNDTTCTFTSSDEEKVYIDYSVKVTYHANGGKVDTRYSLDDTFVDYYPVAFFKCPVAVNPSYFFRSGYVLSEYKTEDGYVVSPGSRFPCNTNDINVYCVWEEANPKTDFEYSGGTITKYIGTAKNVVIPESINGNVINTISSNAIDNDSIERLFIPRTVQNIENYAIQSDSLTELIIHDSITRISNESIYCPNMKNLRINGTSKFHNIGNYNKYDRLLWARDYKKIVIYGASGSLYGWDCEELNKAYGDEYVIVNLGMNANICSSVVFEGMTPFFKEGDILLWACEPGNRVLGDTHFDYNLTWYFSNTYWDLFRNIDISYYSNLFEGFGRINNEKMHNGYSYHYVEMEMNIYGDSVSKRENRYDRYPEYRFDYFTGYDYSHMTQIINNLKSKGVDVLFTFAAMIENSTSDKPINYYRQQFLKNFDVEIISSSSNCYYPLGLFCDSEWHLTNEGAHIRTLRVINDLNKYFNK